MKAFLLVCFNTGRAFEKIIKEKLENYSDRLISSKIDHFETRQRYINVRVYKKWTNGKISNAERSG